MKHVKSHSNPVSTYLRSLNAPWYALPLIFGSMLLVFGTFRFLTLSPYESVKPILLWQVNRPPKVGDYVTFPHSHPLIKTQATAWIKLLTCVEGSYFKRENDAFYCDERLIAPARLKSKANADLPQFYFEGVIPKNKAFVIGDGVDSFDSRHFGFVDLDIMTANIELLPGPFSEIWLRFNRKKEVH